MFNNFTVPPTASLAEVRGVFSHNAIFTFVFRLIFFLSFSTSFFPVNFKSLLGLRRLVELILENWNILFTSRLIKIFNPKTSQNVVDTATADESAPRNRNSTKKLDIFANFFFHFTSTFKKILFSIIFERFETKRNFDSQKIKIEKKRSDLHAHSPVRWLCYNWTCSQTLLLSLKKKSQRFFFLLIQHSGERLEEKRERRRWGKSENFEHGKIWDGKKSQIFERAAAHRVAVIGSTHEFNFQATTSMPACHSPETSAETIPTFSYRNVFNRAQIYCRKKLLLMKTMLHAKGEQTFTLDRFTRWFMNEITRT